MNSIIINIITIINVVNGTGPGALCRPPQEPLSLSLSLALMMMMMMMMIMILLLLLLLLLLIIIKTGQGLELSVDRLKSLAKYAFGLGTLQVTAPSVDHGPIRVTAPSESRPHPSRGNGSMHRTRPHPSITAPGHRPIRVTGPCG